MEHQPGGAGSLATGSCSLASANDLVITAWSSFTSSSSTNLLSVDSGLGLIYLAGGNLYNFAMAFGSASNFAPTNMTSDNTPSPYVASASSYYLEHPYGAFTATGGRWLASGATNWLQIDLGTGTSNVMNCYSFGGNTDTSGRAPKDWTMKGSNDGSTFTTLDTETGQSGWGSYEKRMFCTTNTTGYRYYRLDVTANNGDTYVNVTGLQLYAYSTFGSSINPTWSIPSGSVDMRVALAAFKPDVKTNAAMPPLMMR